MTEFNLICLGCGPAGEKAATQASYFGHKVAIVEREPHPGGAMVNTGTIPSKALRETALLCSAFRRRPMPGLSLDIRHDMSISSFMARKHLVQMQEHDRIEGSVDRHGIEVYRGHGRFIDAHTIEINRTDGSTERIRGEHILIATGSTPHQPDHLPFDHPGVVDADGVLELDRMPDSMAIIGGGVIGTEYACVFAEMGVEVTLIEPRDALLPFVDHECRDILIRSMLEAGVDLRLSTNVGGVTIDDDDRVAVRLEPGGELRCDVLLWAAGRQGNTMDIGLENIDVAANNRGYLEVNGHFQTAVENVYAAGDVVGYPALASVSMEQGRVAACHMFNLGFKARVAETFPIGIYTVPPIAMVGPMEEAAAESGHTVVIGRASFQGNARGRMLDDGAGLCKLVFDGETRQLLGAAIVGEQATELIHIAQTVIATGEGMDFFINACFNYPTLSELYKYATYDALQTLAKLGSSKAA